MHRRTVAAFAALFAIAGGLAPAASAAPPPHIANRQIESENDIQRATERVRKLSKQVADAKKTLAEAQTKLAAAYEKVTSAQRKARAAKEAAESARQLADRTHKEAVAAEARARKARKEVDRLAAASLRLGNLDSARAYLGADDVQDVLARKSLLKAISASQADTLHDLRQASTRKTKKEEAARAALRKSVDKHDAAQHAAAEAEQAYEHAKTGEQAAQQRAEDLVQQQEDLRAQLEKARRRLAALREQRQAPEPDPGSSQPDQRTLAAAVQTGGAEVVAPASGTVTSGYGPRGGSIHYGLDIANSIGTPVVSAMDGTVISSGPASGFGRWVRVRHNNGIVTVYGHIHESLVSVGQHVSAGQRIATIGNRGQSTGPHLHFGVRRSGHKINPLTWLRSHGVSL